MQDIEVAHIGILLILKTVKFVEDQIRDMNCESYRYRNRRRHIYDKRRPCIEISRASFPGRCNILLHTYRFCVRHVAATTDITHLKRSKFVRRDRVVCDDMNCCLNLSRPRSRV